MRREDSRPNPGLADLERNLHERGLPLTIQRRVVYQSLQNRTDHPTAEGIFESVRDRIPGISRATVYRVLETLVRVGAARRVDHPGSSGRFDPRTDHHHHLVCLECGKVVDFEPPKREKMTLPDSRRTGFEVLDYSIHFTGICSGCRGKRSVGAGRT